MQTNTVGLVLGSGASRGWAHIGVIEALREAGIPIHVVAGCSVGAFVGAVFASGGLEQLKASVIDMDGERMFSLSDLAILRPGLIDGDKKLRELFSRYSDAQDFSELAIPLKVVATDMHSGDQVVFKSGDLFEALRASLSFPGLFAPVRYKGRWLIDGGVVDPVPVEVARSMGADIVIAVNLNSELVSLKRCMHSQDAPAGMAAPPVKNPFLRKLAVRHDMAEKARQAWISRQKKTAASVPGVWPVLNASIQLMQDRITRVNLAVNAPDILIEPRLGDLKMLDYDQVAHSIEEGYRATQNKMNDITVFLNR